MTLAQWVGLASELMGILAVTMLLTLNPKFKNQRPLVFLYPLREGVVSLLVFGVLLGLGFLVYNNPNWVERLVPESIPAAAARLDQHLALSIAGLLIVVVALLYRRQPARSAGWNRALLTPALQLGIAAVLLTIFLRGALSRLLSGVSSTEGSALFFLAAIALAEECVFRGFIQLRLVGWLGQIPGWLAASGLFTLYQIPRLAGLPLETFFIQLVISLAQGLLAGWMMVKCRHILAPALYRGASTWLSVLM